MRLPFSRRFPEPPTGPSGPCVSAAHHPYQILDFFAFRGRLHCRGLVEHAVADHPAFLLQFPDNSWLPAQARPDPTQPTTGTRTAFAFSAELPPHFPAADVTRVALAIQFKDAHLRLENPT